MRTTASGAGSPHVKASFTPAAGTVLSKPLLQVEGLEPNAPVDAFWMTARGNRVTASGWSLADIPLGTVTADSSGRIAGPVEVPDDLGGWHTLKLVQNGQVVAEAPYFVERSLVSVSATKLRAGESFTVNIKGVGWTELDNGFAMTYDNAYAGYACGFNSNGDVTLELVATGGPGTHLIDLYPMVYAGKDAKWWYWTPVLTYARDFPRCHWVIACRPSGWQSLSSTNPRLTWQEVLCISATSLVRRGLPLLAEAPSHWRWRAAMR